jgi:hypothetical protein
MTRVPQLQNVRLGEKGVKMKYVLKMAFQMTVLACLLTLASAYASAQDFPQPAIKALDVCVLGWLSRLNVYQLDLSLHTPG